MPHAVKQWAQEWTEPHSGRVHENIREAFIQADIHTRVFHHELTGNSGLRLSHTSQCSPGLQPVGNGQGVPITHGLGVVSKDFIRVDPGQADTNHLPSVNRNSPRTDPVQSRFAAALSHRRADLRAAPRGAAGPAAAHTGPPRPIQPGRPAAGPRGRAAALRRREAAACAVRPSRRRRSSPERSASRCHRLPETARSGRCAPAGCGLSRTAWPG